MGMSSFKERLKVLGPSTKTVPVIIGADLDLLEEYERLQADVEAARPDDSLAGNSARSEASERMRAIEDALAGNRFDFRLRGLDDKRWQELLAEHPPRQVDGKPVADDRLGWNAVTFPAALVRVCVIDPELDDEDWLELLGDDGMVGKLPSSELDKLSAAAFRLSRVQVDVPFW